MTRPTRSSTKTATQAVAKTEASNGRKPAKKTGVAKPAVSPRAGVKRGQAAASPERDEKEDTEKEEAVEEEKDADEDAMEVDGDAKKGAKKTAKKSAPKAAPPARAGAKRGRKADASKEEEEKEEDEMEVNGAEKQAESKKGRKKTEKADAAKKPPVKRVKREFTLPTRYSTSGEVFVVGSGDCGQLGLGPDVLEKERPALLRSLSDVTIVAIFAGGLHNIALTDDGKLWSWGCNDQMALGRGGEEMEPGPVEGLDDEFIVQVACGDSISAALTREGNVYAWGTFRGTNGIFGFAANETGVTTKTQDRPVRLEMLTRIIDIDCGANHMIAIQDGGTVYSWGIAEQGQLGRKPQGRRMEQSSLTPRPCNFRRLKYTRAFCGSYHTFLVYKETEVYAFGLNNHGQLGLGDTDEYEGVWHVDGLEGKVKTISGGEHHSLFLNEDGNVFVWGRADSGQLGLEGQTEPVCEPRRLEVLSNVRQVAGGGSFSLAVTNEEANNLYGWGYGEMGQLANGGEDSATPFKVELKGRQVIMAAAGGQHTVLLVKPKDQ
ncbi:Regulator of chromosome condensation [Borealophlyctis nickersoniae]|nr:Regulator of chromosome condensation [Borealophlyctis nickersoniae]